MKRLALVNMPFGSIYRPSIGLGLLKAALQKDGHAVDVFYFNLGFAERIGLELYSTLTDIPSSLIGEWAFAQDLNGDDAHDDVFFAGFTTDAHLAFKDQCMKMRRDVGPFLDQILAEVDWGAYDVVGFTSVFEQTTASLALAKRIKAVFPAVRTALGGANAEGPMGRALLQGYDFLDVVCSGEGDVSFPRYIRSLDEAEPPAIPGIVVRGAPGRGGGQMVVHDMDGLPHPDYDDYFEQFARTSFAEAEVSKTEILFESSRGCWWGEKSHCKFCGLNGSGMVFRSKNASRLTEELTALKTRYGGHTKRFFATDNILDYKYFRDFLPDLRDSGENYNLFYEVKANLNRDQIRLLRDANIRVIQPGIESLSSSILKLMGKGVSALQNIQLLKLCREFGVKPIWNVIFGFPGEDPAEYARVAQMAAALSHLEPPSGCYKVRMDRFSPYFNQAADHGLINVRPFRQYGLVHSGLPAELVFDLAYYFEFDYADGREPEAYVGPLAKQLMSWIDRKGESYLFFEDIDDALYLFSYREGFPKGLVVLRGTDRSAYHLLEKALPVAQLHYLLAEDGYGGTEQQLQGRLDQFVARGLMINEGDRYLAVAVRLGEYRPPEQVRAIYASAVVKAQERMAMA